MRTVPFLALAIALGAALAHGGAAHAQPRKGPAPKPVEIYEKFRATMGEGKYDVAGIFLEEFLKSGPTDADYLELEKKYGTTVFQMLRTVPKYSDDPATEKKIRNDIEVLNRNALAVTAKNLYKPERVAKYIRNLGETYEEKVFAQQELRRTGEYAIPFMIDAIRTNPSKDLYAGILDTIPVLEGPTMAGWVAALDILAPDRQYGVLRELARRRDVKVLLNNAQTDFTPFLWRVLSRPRAESPTLHDLAAQLHNELVPGPKADAKRPEVELTALARKYYDHKGRYLGAKTNPDGSAALVPVWVATQRDGISRIDRLPDVPVGQAEEYYGLRFARWALDVKPDYEPAQALVLALAAERAIERARFGHLAATEPAVYKLLADAPSRALTDLLARGLVEKRTPLVLAMVQVLGDRADREAATPPAGAGQRPSLLVRALSYPDHSVQFAAASALLRGPVPVPPDAKLQIVEILRRAAGLDGAKPAESKGTVLLVDPGKFRADANAALLRGFGYDVEILGSGRDLLRRTARASDFDLIFIDHHAANPELIDLIGQVTSDRCTAGRPVFVIASPDKPRPPTFDQLVLRTAELIAATESDVVGIPAPYTPDPKYTPEEQDRTRKEVQQRRDAVFREAATVRATRLQRVIDTLPMTLTDNQKRLLDLRVHLISYSVLGAEFPITPDSAPETVAELNRIRNQIALQPPSALYGTNLASTDLMKLIERFEVDVLKAKGAHEKYDFFRSKVDPVELGLSVEPFRDPLIEARLARLLKNYPEVRIIPEPYTRLALEPEFKVLFADPMMVPREGAVKKAESRAAIEFLRQMAVGDLPGYDFRLAEAELRNAINNPFDADRTSAAIDAVERLKSAEAQQALLGLATRSIGNVPTDLRRKAADAAIRHIRANGKAATPILLDGLNREASPDVIKDPDLLAKLLTLKGMLAYNPGSFANQLKTYNPPIVPAPPKKEPEKKAPPM
ncbi:MAG TPA: hypothetical protein VGE74_10000 [Gemmata sp.]